VLKEKEEEEEEGAEEGEEEMFEFLSSLALSSS
jgi:hypothetical protein